MYTLLKAFHQSMRDNCNTDCAYSQLNPYPTGEFKQKAFVEISRVSLLKKIQCVYDSSFWEIFLIIGLLLVELHNYVNGYSSLEYVLDMNSA